MDLQDHLPERRNLIVTSLLIIAFYLGDGALTGGGNSMSLGFINVELKNPEAIFVMTWILLFWFSYRYILSSKGSYRDEYLKELTSKPNNFINRLFLRIKLGDTVSVFQNPEKLEVGEKCVQVVEVGLIDNKLPILSWDGIECKQTSQTGITRSKRRVSIVPSPDGSPLGSGHLKFDGVVGWVFLLAHFIRLSVFGKAFGSYVVPHLLAATAVILAIKDFI